LHYSCSATAVHQRRVMHFKDLDPLFAEMNEATEKAVEELPARERALLSVVADVCLQTLGRPFEHHVLAGHEAGVSPDDFRELLRFISYDSGYPAAAEALRRLTEIEQTYALPKPTGRGHDLNLTGTESPIPANTRQAVHTLDNAFGDYMDLQSRMRAGMQQISVRERAFATVTVDVLYQTLAESFELHVSRALRASATPEEVRAVVRFAAQFGMTKAWRAMRALDALLSGTGTVLP
jgi:alkylhydroperoxidase/carboxymuconolactone decarboxylase family protein YurZ